MLTWPCVTIEWKTPAIHAVDVSDASSGTRPSPVRRICPCGRSTPRSFAREHHVSIRADEEGVEPAVLALDVAQLAAEEIGDLALAEIAAREPRAGAEQRRRRRDEVRFLRSRRSRGCGLGQRERAIDEREVRRRRRRRMIGLEPAEEAARDARARLESHRLVLQHRHRVLVLLALARQRLGAQSRRSGAAAAAPRP